MAADGEKRTFPTDILYLLTFALGMAMFWASGHVGQLLPVMRTNTLAIAIGLGVTAGVYGLGMLILSLIVTKRVIPTLAATLVAVVLGLIAAQLILAAVAGHLNLSVPLNLGLLTFVLYLCYGGIYALALAIGRKIAARRAL
jgi:hypothetical protein